MTTRDDAGDAAALRTSEGGAGGLAIGALSRACGIPVETLRTWERRYGFPEPERTDSGHRLYPAHLIDHLRLIAKALASGHRAGQVLRATPRELEELLRTRIGEIGTDEPVECRVPSEADHLVDTWVDLTRRLDGGGLDQAFRAEWHHLGALRFLDERAGPFLVAIGDAWATGRIDVMHEHFASERLRDFLASSWRPLSDASQGPCIVCATLPGEHHALGLYMAASILGIAGARVVYLGSDTPVAELERAVSQSHADAVAISVSRAAHPARAAATLVALRRRLPTNCQIVCGGAGAPPPVDGVTTLATLADLDAWVRAFVRERSASRN